MGILERIGWTSSLSSSHWYMNCQLLMTLENGRSIHSHFQFYARLRKWDWCYCWESADNPYHWHSIHKTKQWKSCLQESGDEHLGSRPSNGQTNERLMKWRTRGRISYRIHKRLDCLLKEAWNEMNMASSNERGDIHYRTTGRTLCRWWQRNIQVDSWNGGVEGMRIIWFWQKSTETSITDTAWMFYWLTTCLANRH